MQDGTTEAADERPPAENSDIVQRDAGSTTADEVLIECGPVLRQEETEITVAGYRIENEAVGVELSAQVEDVWVNAGLTPEAARELADRLRSAAAAAENTDASPDGVNSSPPK